MRVGRYRKGITRFYRKKQRKTITIVIKVVKRK